MINMRKTLRDLVLTFDIDWAPDFMIEHVANILINRQVKATWFVTHFSPVLSLLRIHPDLFELGIHPNFLSNSTHGMNPDEVLNHCLSLVPEARSMRTHSLMQSTPLINKAITLTPITLDSSIYLPHMEGIRPVSYWWQGKELLRLPIFWEDDLEMERADGCWTLEALTHYREGLKIFDFHVIHIYMNAKDMTQYRELRDRAPLNQLTHSDLHQGSLQQQGSGSLFLEIADYLAESKSSLCLRDLDKRQRNS
jgi:peptidoglycan/xylan/chitin deacetylase (PgdA/CDA1 family)